MDQGKQIEALQNRIAAREAEVNAQLAACETRLLESGLRIQGYALRGVEPRFGLSLQWKSHEDKWFLSIRRKSNFWPWREASIEDRTCALELIDPLLSKLISNAMDLARKIGATLP